MVFAGMVLINAFRIVSAATSAIQAATINETVRVSAIKDRLKIRQITFKQLVKPNPSIKIGNII